MTAETAAAAETKNAGEAFVPKGGIVVLDFGGQYTQLIARRIREQEVFSAILPCTAKLEEIRALEPVGIVLSGGPSSVYDAGAPVCDPQVLQLHVPVLGICYGMQWMTHTLGGRVERADRREYGPAELGIRQESPLFKDLPRQLKVWESHGDHVVGLPEGFAMLDGGHCVLRPPRNLESLGQSDDVVAMAFPDFELARKILEQRRFLANSQFRRPVFAPISPLHSSAKRVRHPLHAIANPQHRQMQLQHLRVADRRARVINGTWTSRKNDPHRFQRANFFQLRGARKDGREDFLLANPAANELRILAAKIENDNAALRHEGLASVLRFRGGSSFSSHFSVLKFRVVNGSTASQNHDECGRVFEPPVRKTRNLSALAALLPTPNR